MTIDELRTQMSYLAQSWLAESEVAASPVRAWALKDCADALLALSVLNVDDQ